MPSQLRSVAARAAGNPLGFVREALVRAAYAPRRPRADDVRVVTHRGARFEVYANEDLGWRLLTQGRYEDAEMEAVDALLRPGEACVDVGANVGLYAVLMARRAAPARVWALEPLARYLDLLRRNLEANGVANVELVAAAASDHAGTAEFSVSKDAVFSSLRPTGRRPERARVRVPTVTLDGLLAGASGPLGMVKVDVEGAELPVLRGADQLLREARPRALLVELNEVNQAAFGYAPADVVAHLAARGYRPRSITRRGLVDGWPVRGAAEDVLFVR